MIKKLISQFPENGQVSATYVFLSLRKNVFTVSSVKRVYQPFYAPTFIWHCNVGQLKGGRGTIFNNMIGIFNTLSRRKFKFCYTY